MIEVSAALDVLLIEEHFRLNLRIFVLGPESPNHVVTNWIHLHRNITTLNIFWPNSKLRIISSQKCLKYYNLALFLTKRFWFRNITKNFFWPKGSAKPNKCISCLSGLGGPPSHLCLSSLKGNYDDAQVCDNYYLAIILMVMIEDGVGDYNYWCFHEQFQFESNTFSDGKAFLVFVGIWCWALQTGDIF